MRENDRKPKDDELRYVFTENGQQKYAFIPKNDLSNYIEIIEATFLYTSYYDEKKQNFYMIEVVSRYEEMSELEKVVFESGIERLVGRCTTMKYKGNKFNVSIPHQNKPICCYVFECRNVNQFVCGCKKSRFKVTVYVGKMMMYDVHKEHGKNCILDSNDEDSDESLDEV